MTGTSHEDLSALLLTSRT